MRINFVLASADLSGGCKVIAIQARELAARGHDVTVVALRPPWSLGRRARALLRGTRDAADEPNHLDLQGVPYRYSKTTRAVTAEDLPDGDVVIATWWQTAEWIRDLPASKGAKAYFIQHHEVHMPFQPNERVNATWKLPYHKITISRWLVDLARDFGDDDVTLVPNSVDPAQFHAPPREKQPRPTVGLMYATAPMKGLDVSLAALDEVAGALPDLRLVSFGLDDVAAQLPLLPGAEFTKRPAQEQIGELYAQCDVWLCGSRAEGFHLPPLEAMACRCPVVSTRVGGPMDIIEPGRNGYLVDVGDSAGLARHLRELLTLEPAAWKRFSDAAYATSQGYTWRDAAVRFEAGLARAIEKQSRTLRV